VEASLLWQRRGGGFADDTGKLLFAADGAGSLVAYDAATGKPLVEYAHRPSNVTEMRRKPICLGWTDSNLIAATGDTLWSFVLY